MEKRTLEGLKRKREYSKLWMKRQSPEKRLIYSARARAKRKEIEFSISEEDITVPDVCPILGIPLVVGSGRQSYNSPSIDRKNNNKGYVKGNVGVISLKANALKNDMSVEQIERLHRYVLGLA
jgi:hypothetical protein